MKIGYKASAEQFGPRDLVEYAVRAEELGLDSVVVSDHFLPWRHQGGHAPFALSWMAAVIERTERVQIGSPGHDQDRFQSQFTEDLLLRLRELS